MRPRRIRTITVQWAHLGIRRSRQFNSQRLADEFVETLVRTARQSAAFSSTIRMHVETEVVVEGMAA